MQMSEIAKIFAKCGHLGKLALPAHNALHGAARSSRGEKSLLARTAEAKSPTNRLAEQAAAAALEGEWGSRGPFPSPRRSAPSAARRDRSSKHF